MLFSRSADVLANGNLPAPDVIYDVSLANDPGALFVGIADSVLDSVTWTTSTAGVSLQLDRDEYTTAMNDMIDVNGCGGSTTYGDGDAGTPGDVNTDCLGIGECLDGGIARPIASPQIGDLYINEVMPNPATSEGTTEWFEVFVVNDVDLNGVAVNDHDTSYQLIDSNCLRVTTGSYLVFARSTDPLANGGLPSVDFLTTPTISMLNTDGSALALDGRDDVRRRVVERDDERPLAKPHQWAHRRRGSTTTR